MERKIRKRGEEKGRGLERKIRETVGQRGEGKEIEGEGKKRGKGYGENEMIGREEEKMGGKGGEEKEGERDWWIKQRRGDEG